MANTYSQIYLQIVFGIRGSGNTLPVKHKEELQAYIGGIANHRKAKLLAANTLLDHTHLLLSIRPSESVSDLVRDIKANSTTLIKTNGWVLPSFKWQDGFGCFSYGRSQLDDVIKYIDNQEEHHRIKTFREEYLGLLNVFGVEYELQYVFDKDQVLLPIRGS